MHKVLRSLLVAGLLGSGLVVGQFAVANAAVSQGEGITSVPSRFGPDETIARLTQALADADADVIGVTDHAADVAAAGYSIRPTAVISFGNPNFDTVLIEDSVGAGLDLPPRLLVWEAADGQTFVSYNDTDFLADRHMLGNDATAALEAWAGVIGEATAAVSTAASPAAPQEPQLARTGGEELVLAAVATMLFAGGLVALTLQRRNTKLLVGVGGSLAIVAAVTAYSGANPAEAMDDPGVIEVASSHSVEDTLIRVRQEATERGYEIRSTISQAVGSTDDAMMLEPTFLISFSKPDTAGQLLESGQTIGIDLPQKMLVVDDGDATRILYNDATWLGQRHGVIEAQPQLIADLGADLGAIAAEAGR
ncbi:MAG: DUF302 domain-containing protein [Actinomycetota bacterium]|nr:DUF302 domain-containing protein [Actinomycetota bacterium]